MKTVCLCILHPLVLRELSDLIAGHSFRPLACRLDAAALARRGLLRIPRATLYVVDSPSRREDAEYLVSQVLSRFPRARVLVVAERLDESSSYTFLRLGVKGLLRYSEINRQLIEALQALAAGGFWGPRILLSRFIDKELRGKHKPAVRPPGAALSHREEEVLEALLENLSNKEIANRLHISSRTVKFHVSNLLAKHGVRGRADLLMMRSA